MGNFRAFISLGVISVALTCALGQSTSTDTIFFRHYNKNGSHADINIKNVTLLISKLDLAKSIMFYIHGFNENVNSTSVIIVTNAYLMATDINVVAIDYGKIAANNYLILSGLVDSIAQAIAESLNQLVASGLNQHKIHIVGHSFGAQVSGQTGARTKNKIPRITGLDPAGPLFYTSKYLNASNAEFVDIIHTDKLVYGQPYNSGSVNLHPNYGHRLQPGCPLLSIPLSNEDFCSHHRSWWFYAESVINPSGFLAVQCANDLSFQTNSCNYSDTVQMGFDTPSTARGVYYLHTNSQSPFARGQQGTRS